MGEVSVQVNWVRLRVSWSFASRLFAEQLRDNENYESATEAAAEKEIQHRIAGSGNGQNNKGEIIHRSEGVD